MTDSPAPADMITRLNSALEGRYVIERELGEGGMATVYLADDLKHERKVALKVLKPELAAVVGAERFLAEIKTTANLQHPHILPLFDSGEAGSFLFYVMPYVEGESLRDRIDREKQLPVDEAVRITTDVAEALHSAHEQGVIHRDIKPANILLSKGRPLVADFGIALAVSAAGGGRLTETGLSMGTPYYMSPEQASADRDPSPASDAYSLGCVLYEMLVGEPPHTGASAQAVLAKILTHEAPAPTEARTAIPAHVDAAVRKSLEKIPADRFTGADDFAKALADPTFRHGESLEALAAAGAGPWKARAIAAAAVAVVALLGWSWSALQPEPIGIDYAIGLQFPADQDFAGTETFDLSPDGSFIVYEGPMAEGGTQLWLRRLDELIGRPITGTEGGAQPEISPDGTELLFTIPGAGADDLAVVPVNGGVTRILTDSIRCCGTWGPDGQVFAQGPGQLIVRVPTNGSGMETLALASEGGGQWNPRVIPGGRAIVYSEGVDPEIVVLDLETREPRPLGLPGDYPRVVGERLFFVSADGSLMAQEFDLNTLEGVGPPVPVFDGLVLSVTNGLRDAHVAIAAETGTILYRTGEGLGVPTPVWVERNGLSTPIDEGWEGEYRSPALSPDETRLAVDSAGALICVKELPSGPCQRLTFDGITNHRPVWSPDGRNIVFASNRATQERFDLDLYQVRSDGSNEPELIWDVEASTAQAVWAFGGEGMVYRTAVSGASANATIGMGDGDLFWFRFGDESPTTFWATPTQERQPALSSDGRWLAYTTNRSGRNEVVVRPFPEGDALLQISTAGGLSAAWSPVGDEIFFMNASGALVSARLEEEAGEISVVERTELFQVDGRFFSDQNQRQYDVSADGQRFVMMEHPTGDADRNREIILIENWIEALSQRLGN